MPRGPIGGGGEGCKGWSLTLCSATPPPPLSVHLTTLPCPHPTRCPLSQTAVGALMVAVAVVVATPIASSPMQIPLASLDLTGSFDLFPQQQQQLSPKAARGG